MSTYRQCHMCGQNTAPSAVTLQLWTPHGSSVARICQTCFDQLDDAGKGNVAIGLAMTATVQLPYLFQLLPETSTVRQLLNGKSQDD